MPIYDYTCRSCGRTVEVIHSVTAAGPTACQHCGGEMRKALSAPAVVFKGSGWAKKDARSARVGSASTSDTGAGDTADKTAAASDSAPSTGAAESQAAT